MSYLNFYSWDKLLTRAYNLLVSKPKDWYLSSSLKSLSNVTSDAILPEPHDDEEETMFVYFIIDRNLTRKQSLIVHHHVALWPTF